MEQRINAAACLFEIGAKDHVAIECGPERITYGELQQAVARAAGAWKSLGLEPEGRVVIFAPDSIDFVKTYLGAIWAGGAAIAVNPRLGMPDLGAILKESVVSFIWTTAELAPRLTELTRSLPQRIAVVASHGGDIDWGETCEAAQPIPPLPRSEDDIALWIGTSGTTGTPKGVMHKHSVTTAAAAFAREILHAGPQDRLYATSKLFFAYALANSLFAGMRLGATVILDSEWPTAERVEQMVKEHRPTILFCVPTLYHKMLQADVAGRLRGNGIRHFISAGEALPQSVSSAWKKAAGSAPISCYGTSETLSLMLYCDDESGRLKPTPLTQFRYGDLPPDQPQRIWVKHPAIARGYWQRPAEQADGFRDGWFSPGDMFLRHDGWLEFTGRNDDMLKIAGQWVSTQWVEQALRAACGDTVQEIAAVGVKSAEGLTAIAAFMVAAPAREEAARQSAEAGIASLPGHKRPRWLHWVDALPQTATGKLQRSMLGKLHERQVGS
ncbi:4-hydroxybenzoate--CoA ligase [Herbaspirillum sp. HC18]|nr:4-hydroxybenzoate--CoA ligase [Herbaspirillum sp. HC18]